jgi:MFS family permease
MNQPLTSAVASSAWAPGRKYRLAVAITLMVVYALNQLDRQILAILLEPIKQDFQLSDLQAGLLSGMAFALFYTTLGVPMARWADRGHRVGMIAIAVFVWSGMTALCGAAANFTQLLLARVGVGVGEAGCTPPAHSLLADYYPVAERSRGMAIYALGTPLGSSLGLLIGGIINHFYGWRAAFLAVGLPGVAMAMVTWLVVREPRRLGAATVAPPPSMPLRQVARKLLATPSYLHICVAVTAFCVSAYSISVWGASYQVRAFGVSTAVLGPASALAGLVSGLIGVGIGGWLGDRLALRDRRWLVWLPGIALLVGIPFGLISLTATSWQVCLAGFVVPLATFYVYAGPCFGLIQSLMPPAMRAVAVSMFLLTTNLIGLGLGPVVTGALSDWFGQGAEGLRLALACTTVFTLWGAVHFFLAARSLRADLAAVEAAN